MDRPWRAAIACFSHRVGFCPRALRQVDSASGDELAVSRTGTLAAADLEIPSTGETITVVSMYGVWESPIDETASSRIYADASAHRLISDLSALIGRQRGHKIIAAGDLNMLHGDGEDGTLYWKGRYDTVFARMEALGMEFVGPQVPSGGQQADPWPDELPADSLNVPTYTPRIGEPESARRQLDFVFASTALRGRVTARALNRVEEWGPSDHCRILIELATV
jgi:hypothetical protein